MHPAIAITHALYPPPRRTKKWEAHIWDNRKQLYLGGYDIEEHAGVAHDVMAIKCRLHAPINFPLDEFRDLVGPIQALPKDTIVYLLRRKGTSNALKARQATAVKKAIRKPKRKVWRWCMALRRLRLSGCHHCCAWGSCVHSFTHFARGSACIIRLTGHVGRIAAVVDGSS